MLTNREMYLKLQQLEPLMDHTDIVGYAAARNARLLRDACAEFLDRQEQLVSKYGEVEVDSEGNPTGRISIDEANPNFDTFMESLSEIAELEHEFEPYVIPAEKAIGILSGSQMIAFEWMLGFEE